MSRALVLSPFDWPRFEALRASVGTPRLEELLARGAPWRDPEAPQRLARHEQSPIRLPGVFLRVALEAAPARFAAEGAAFVASVDEPGAALLLVRAAATARPAELPMSKDLLLGLFSEAWRGGFFPGGFPARTAPEPLVAALGGLEPGVSRLDPAAVRRAADGLAHVELPSGLRPWRDGVDVDGQLDELLRQGLRELISTFRDAARAGWAMQVVG